VADLAVLTTVTRPGAAPESLYADAARAYLNAERCVLHIEPPTAETVTWEAGRPELRAAVDATWTVATRERDERQRRIAGAVHLLDTADPDLHPGRVAVLLDALRTVLTSSRDEENSHA
jgi:hypothetical protein